MDDEGRGFSGATRYLILLQMKLDRIDQYGNESKWEWFDVVKMITFENWLFHLAIDCYLLYITVRFISSRQKKRAQHSSQFLGDQTNMKLPLDSSVNVLFV